MRRCSVFLAPGKRMSPATPIVHGHDEECLLETAAMVRDEVLTIALICAGNCTLAGTEQAAPIGAPVHIKLTGPTFPTLPLSDTANCAVCPAATVDEGEPGGKKSSSPTVNVVELKNDPGL